MCVASPGLSGQSIRRVDFPWDMSDFDIVSLKDTDPFPNASIDAGLVRQVTKRAVIGLHNQLSALKIVAPFAYGPHDAEELAFVRRISHLRRRKLFTLIGNRL